jgi:hypothetical protein
MERVTSTQTFQAQPDASSGAVHFDRLAHVLRARWIEPAGRGQKRGYQAFVTGEEQDEEFAHLI